ncbi:MAG: DNA methyltransferase, partial [Promethearchaeota archaeon]
MGNQERRKKTQTSSFGSPKRESHDSSKFYEGRLYQNQKKELSSVEKVNLFPSKFENEIFSSSAENMEEIPGNSIHLMVSSPPYNVGKEYDNDISLEEYLEFLNRVWIEVKRVLVPGGRACINIANLGRKPYLPLHS